MYLAVWSTCADESSFQRTIRLSTKRLADFLGAPSTFDLGSICVTYLTNDDVRTPQFRYGFCSRRMVNILVIYLVSKWAIDCFLFPSILLMARVIFGPVARSGVLGCSRNATLHFDSAYSKWLAKLLELMCFGAFTPLLLYIGLLALLTNYACLCVALRLECWSNAFAETYWEGRGFASVEKGIRQTREAQKRREHYRLPQAQLHLAVLFASLFAVLFFIENDLSGKWFLTGVLITLVAVDSVYLLKVSRALSCCQKAEAECE